MINKNGNDGINAGFDDEPLDDFEGDFSDSDYDESVIDDAEFTDLPDDGEYVDEDFDGGEWEEEQQPAGKKGKKEKSLYQTGEKSGLSFNTIVIIGAVIVGGAVMAFTVMNKTAEVAAGQKTIFQSVLSIGGVMDGTFFGEKDEEPTQEQKEAEIAAAEQGGFLNNPDAALPENPNLQADGNPPQPVPISPEELSADTLSPLTPMPEGGAGIMPRGPDDSIPMANETSADAVAAIPTVPAPDMITPVEQATVPSEEKEPTAQDILQQAINKREQKTQQKEEAQVVAVTPAAPSPPAPTTVEQAPAAAVVPAVPVAPSVDPAVVEAASKAAEQNAKAVSGLETKIDTLLKRMEQIENELGSVQKASQQATQQASSSTNTKELEEQIASLKKEIVAIKEKPAPQAVQEKKAESKLAATQLPIEEADEEIAAPVQAKPKPAVVKKKKAASAAPKKSSASVQSGSSGRWELRAAQPGRAWVSKPGERDMQSVEIGQSLPGVGQITGITYQNGRWAVTGTQGQIRQ